MPEQLYLLQPAGLQGRAANMLFTRRRSYMPDGRSSPLFDLPEYKAAFERRFELAVEALCLDKSPLLAQIPVEEVPQVTRTHHVAPSGERVSSQPLALSLAFSVAPRDVILFDLAAFARGCDSAADTLTDARLDSILGETHRLTDAFGLVADGQGRPLSWPPLLEALARIELDFNDDGTPNLPLLVHSRFKRAIQPYPEMSATDREALEVLLARKREEFNARRRTRSIS